MNPTDVSNLTGAESFFTSDDYLIPVIEDDPLLRKPSSRPLSLLPHQGSNIEIGFDDDWSDDDGPSVEHGPDLPSDLPSALKRIQILEKKLSQAQNDLSDYRRLVTQNLDISSIADIINDPGPSASEALRDDDTHYFSSYEYNGMRHLVVLEG